MIDPNKVISPRNRLKNIIKARDYGSFSIAILEWDEEKRVGIRWNGKYNELGFPTSKGYPTWFIMPKEVALAYTEKIGDIEMRDAVIRTTDKDY